MDLESVLCSPDGFGLESATFLQRAISRAEDGVDTSDLLARGTDFERRCFETAIGCSASLLPVGCPPTEVVDMEPVRTGKSLRMAALAVTRSQTVRTDIVKAGEDPPRISILATELDQADAVRGHLNIINERPALRALKIGEDADSITIRNPSGLAIQIKVIAAKRGGYSLASRWSASVIFDEAPSWNSTDRVISLEDSRDQAIDRLLPGAQNYFGGSKWQPAGFCFTAHAQYHGKPSREMLVISPQEVDGVSPAQQLNPVHWTDEQIDRVRKASSRSFTMHVQNLFGGAENSVITKDELDACVAASLPEGMFMSPAMCAIDSSALKRDGFCGLFAFFAHPDPTPRQKMIRAANGGEYVERDERGYPVTVKPPDRSFLRVAEVFGFEPERFRKLRIEQVVAHVAERCKAWGVKTVFADHFEETALGGLLSQHQLVLKPYHWSEDSKMQTIGGALRRYVRERTLSLIPHQKLYQELLSIREVPRPGERWGYATTGLDFASALISLLHGLGDPDVVNVRQGQHVRVHGIPHAGRASGKRELVPGR